MDNFPFRCMHLIVVKPSSAILSSNIVLLAGLNVPNKHCPCGTSGQILAYIFGICSSLSHIVNPITYCKAKTELAVITVRCEAHFPVNVDNQSGLCSICPGLWNICWPKLNQFFSSCFCDYLIIANDGVHV